MNGRIMFVVNGKTRCEGCYPWLGGIPAELLRGPYLPCPTCFEKLTPIGEPYRLPLVEKSVGKGIPSVNGDLLPA